MRPESFDTLSRAAALATTRRQALAVFAVAALSGMRPRGAKALPRRRATCSDGTISDCVKKAERAYTLRLERELASCPRVGVGYQDSVLSLNCQMNAWRYYEQLIEECRHTQYCNACEECVAASGVCRVKKCPPCQICNASSGKGCMPDAFKSYPCHGHCCRAGYVCCPTYCCDPGYECTASGGCRLP